MKTLEQGNFLSPEQRKQSGLYKLEVFLEESMTNDHSIQPEITQTPGGEILISIPSDCYAGAEKDISKIAEDWAEEVHKRVSGQKANKEGIHYLFEGDEGGVIEIADAIVSGSVQVERKK